MLFIILDAGMKIPLGILQHALESYTRVNHLMWKGKPKDTFQLQHMVATQTSSQVGL